MGKKLRFAGWLMTGALAITLLTAASRPLFLSESLANKEFQTLTPCATLLLEAANQAGVPGSSYRVLTDNSLGCVVYFYDESYEDSPKRNTLKISATNGVCDLNPPWSDAETIITTFYGYDALIYRAQLFYNGENDAESTGIKWCMPKGDITYLLEVETDSHSISLYGSAADPLPIAEVVLRLAEERLPFEGVGDQAPPAVDQPDEGAQEPPAPIQEDEGAQPNQPQPIPPDTSDSSEPSSESSLPPLVVGGSIAVPIAGAVAGAALAGLMGLMASTASNLAQAGASAAGSIPASPAVSPPAPQADLRPTEPPPAGLEGGPTLQDESPPQPQPPPPQTAAPPETLSRFEKAIVAGTQSPWFDLAKNLTGPASTVVGSLSEFFTFSDSPQVVDSIRKAIQDWHFNPTPANAEAYRQAVRSSINIRLARAAERLDNVSKWIDVVDAVGTGLDKAQARGYTGLDKFLTVGAEWGKKRLTWMLTKNPMVGLTDAAVGGATEMLWGAEGRIDIGSAIDKGAEAWDKVTQEWSGYSEGVLAQDADIQMKDQFLHGLRRIRSQVEQGTLTRQEGIERINRLRNRMFGGNP